MRKLLRCLPIVLLLLCGKAYSQAKNFNGTVVDEKDKDRLANVSVTNQRTKKSVQSENNGTFLIQAEDGDVLELTRVGYFKKKYTVTEDRIVTISLSVNSRQEGEVVVSAYGITKNKQNVSSSFQVINADEVADTRRENVLNGLAGRVAGATITTTSGLPGASTSFILRGGNSMGGNNQALIVVDGIPYDNQTLNQENILAFSTSSRNADYSNRASDINPEDIESITILKGPEASALYGSDGSNGVIMITTKKGKSGKINISYDNSFRFEKAYRFHTIQTEYARGRNGISDPVATDLGFGEAGVVSASSFGSKFTPGTPLFNNIDAFLKGGFTSQHNLSLDGGNDLSTYRLSLSKSKTDGTVPNTTYDRTVISLTNTARLAKWLNLTSRMTYTIADNEKASKGIGSFYLDLLTFPALSDVRDYINPDGSRKLLLGASFGGEYDNPFWEVNKNRSNDKTDRINANVKLNFDLAKGVTLTTQGGIDAYTQKGTQSFHPQSRYGFSNGGFLSTYIQRTRNLNGTTFLSLFKKIGQFTNSLITGFVVDEANTDIDSYKGESFIEPNFVSINNTEPRTRDGLSQISKIRRVRAYSNYSVSYNNMLNFSLAGSYEGSSTLLSRQISKDPYYQYGSVAGSFVFTEIKELAQFIPWLSYGKVRVSYGTTGKSPISPYIIDDRFQNQLTTGGGYAYGVTGNNFGLQPEFTKILDYGVELKFLKNRIGIDITKYRLNSFKQILAARSSYLTGFILKYFNGGEVINEGTEILATFKPVQNKNFKWDFRLNWSNNKNKILSMPAGLPIYYDSDTWVYGNLRAQFNQGASTSSISGIKYLRNKAGDIVVNALTGIPILDPNFQYIADRQSKWVGGITQNLNYKSIGLTFTLDVRKGGAVFNGTELALYRLGLSTRTLNRETPKIIKGVIADGLENTATPTQNNIVINPFYRDAYYTSNIAEENFVEDVSWVRMRDIGLTYEFPKSITEKLKFVKNFRFSVTVTDPFIITNYSGADPSVSSNNVSTKGFGGGGIDYGAISVPRGFNVGCKVTF
jgi:ferric enterobactin receptor